MWHYYHSKIFDTELQTWCPVVHKHFSVLPNNKDIHPQ